MPLNTTSTYPGDSPISNFSSPSKALPPAPTLNSYPIISSPNAIRNPQPPSSNFNFNFDLASYRSPSPIHSRNNSDESTQSNLSQDVSRRGSTSTVTDGEGVGTPKSSVVGMEGLFGLGEGRETGEGNGLPKIVVSGNEMDVDQNGASLSSIPQSKLRSAPAPHDPGLGLSLHNPFTLNRHPRSLSERMTIDIPTTPRSSDFNLSFSPPSAKRYNTPCTPSPSLHMRLLPATPESEVENEVEVDLDMDIGSVVPTAETSGSGGTGLQSMTLPRSWRQNGRGEGSEEGLFGGGKNRNRKALCIDITKSGRPIKGLGGRRRSSGLMGLISLPPSNSGNSSPRTVSGFNTASPSPAPQLQRLATTGSIPTLRLNTGVDGLGGSGTAGLHPAHSAGLVAPSPLSLAPAASSSQPTSRLDADMVYGESRHATPYHDGPREVIPGLWIGSEESISPWRRWIPEQGSGLLINVAEELEDGIKDGTMLAADHDGVKTYAEDFSRPQISYLRLDWSHGEKGLVSAPASDAPDRGEQSKMGFSGAIAIMERARLAGQPILVHCQCGISRSATLVIAYVMYRLCNKSLPTPVHDLMGAGGMWDVYNYVKGMSEWIGPNMSLIYQLMEWDRDLKGRDEEQDAHPHLYREAGEEESPLTTTTASFARGTPISAGTSAAATSPPTPSFPLSPAAGNSPGASLTPSILSPFSRMAASNPGVESPTGSGSLGDSPTKPLKLFDYAKREADELDERMRELKRRKGRNHVRRFTMQGM